MIRASIPPLEFRQDPAAVGALRAFLQTPEGQKFVKALCGGHPLSLLSEPAGTPAKLRDSSLVEGAAGGTEGSLLGKVVGYEMCLATITSLTEDHQSAPHSPSPNTSRIAKALRHDRNP